MKLVVYIVSFILICSAGGSSAQKRYATKQDTSAVGDSIAEPSSRQYGFMDIPEYLPTYTISKDVFPTAVTYGGRDSSDVHVEDRYVDLHGNAYVEYDGIRLEAGHIHLDFKHKEAYARGSVDSTGQMTHYPLFNYENQDITSEELRYNFDTHKAIGKEARLKQGEFFIIGGKTKFISAQKEPKQDSVLTMAKDANLEDLIYQKNALISTCDHHHPHYAIRTRKIKIIPNKIAVLGVSQLVIAGVPTPLILPFGLFPLVEGQSSGLIFPSTYDYDVELGFGLRNIGYYFPINDYMDLTLTGDIYTRGTHRINLSSNFKKRYRYNGSVGLEYANNLRENVQTAKVESSKSYALKLLINQDPKAHPYYRFVGNINISTNNHAQKNYNDYNSQYNNILRSGVTFSNSMPWSPFNYSIGMSHNQNSNTRDFNITLPTMQLNMTTVFPFKSKKRIGDERWYEKISVGYRAELKNSLSTKDTLLFKKETLEKISTGMRHNMDTRANFKLFKYIDFQPSISFAQAVESKNLNKYLNPVPELDTTGTQLTQEGDTLYTVEKRYSVEEAYDFGFYHHHQFDAGASLSTQLFATRKMSRGWLRGIRHTMKPSVRLSYSSPTKGYERSYYTSLNTEGLDPITYNPFTIYRPSLSEERLGVDFAISNILEGKYWSRKDEKAKKFPIFRQLNVSTRYNFAADSLKWSPIRYSGNTELIKGFSRLNISGSFNIYKRNNGRLVNQSVWDAQNRPFEFDNFSLTLTNGFTINSLVKKLQGGGKKTSNTSTTIRRPEASSSRPDHGMAPEGILDFVGNLSLNHTYRMQVSRMEDGRDTLVTNAHYIGVRGQIPLTKKWSLNVDNLSFDLKDGKVVYPSFSLNRDLHCWNMSFSWQPRNRVYSFFIGVKSQNLSFLKYNYGQRNANVLTGRIR